MTDTSGEFSMDGLSDDSYKIYTFHPGQCYKDTWYNNKSSFSNADAVIITNENIISNLNIYMTATNNCGEEIVPGIIQTHLPDAKYPLVLVFICSRKS